MSLLDPVSHALAVLIASVHAALTFLGADPSAGSTWLLCIAAVVVVVRVALLPLTVHGVRLAHASARARPDLKALAERYDGRTDPVSLRRLRAERRRIAAEHGQPRLGCLPLLVQLPIWLALYQLLSDVAAGTPVGAMGPELVGSLGAATVLGVRLAAHGYLGAGAVSFAVISGLAVAAAAITYVTQRYVVAAVPVAGDLPEALAGSMTRAQQLLPGLSALGLLVAGGLVPVALLAYWICSATWTMLQSAVIRRWWPTPGSTASAG